MKYCLTIGMSRSDGCDQIVPLIKLMIYIVEGSAKTSCILTVIFTARITLGTMNLAFSINECLDGLCINIY